ncbi:MAG: hypothetical protein HC837_19775 [Chloroflexaceae bacterium]|nr:hypothetical protein [Chloroflexaceae bacterium]
MVSKRIRDYSDFTLDHVRKAFQLNLQRSTLFPHVTPVEVPSWLTDTLARGRPFALGEAIQRRAAELQRRRADASCL